MLHLPFALHILISLPASTLFFLAPSLTLTSTSPQTPAHGVIRQYALLLLCTCFVAYAFLYSSDDNSGGNLGWGNADSLGRGAVGSGGDRQRRIVAAALGVYHSGPVLRAVGKVRGRRGWGRLWEGGVVVGHLVVGVGLGWEAVGR